jgi:hypothetical protein
VQVQVQAQVQVQVQVLVQVQVQVQEEMSMKKKEREMLGTPPLPQHSLLRFHVLCGCDRLGRWFGIPLASLQGATWPQVSSARKTCFHHTRFSEQGGVGFHNMEVWHLVQCGNPRKSAQQSMCYRPFYI